jgi:hypothetical protein
MSDGNGGVIPYNTAGAAAAVKREEPIVKRQRPTVQSAVMSDGNGGVIPYNTAGAAAVARRSRM